MLGGASEVDGTSLTAIAEASDLVGRKMQPYVRVYGKWKDSEEKQKVRVSRRVHDGTEQNGWIAGRSWKEARNGDHEGGSSRENEAGSTPWASQAHT